MTLPFKPHYIALICSAGLLAAAGTLYVKSREPVTPDVPPAVTATAPEAAPAPGHLHHRANHAVGSAYRTLPRPAAVAGADGLNLSG